MDSSRKNRKIKFDGGTLAFPLADIALSSNVTFIFDYFNYRGLHSPIASTSGKAAITQPTKTKAELQAEIISLEQEERRLDEKILFLTAAIKDVEESDDAEKYVQTHADSGSAATSSILTPWWPVFRFCFVTYDDIRSHASMSEETILAVKAPVGTRLEVPDPDEVRTGLYRQRRSPFSFPHAPCFFFCTAFRVPSLVGVSSRSC